MLKSFGAVGATAAFLFLGLTVPLYSRQERQDKPKNEETKQEDRAAEKQQQSAKPARQDQPQESKHQDQERQQQPQASAQQNPQRQQSRETQDNSAKQQQQAKVQKPQTQDNSAKKQQRLVKGQQSQPLPQQRQLQDKPAKQQQQARVQQDQQPQQSQHQDNRAAQRGSPDQVHQRQVAWQDDRAHDWKSEHRSWQQRGGYNGYRVPDARFRADYGRDHGFRIYSLPVMFVGGNQRFQYGGFWFGLVDPWPEYWSSNWYDSDDVYVDYYGDGYYLYNRRYPGDRIAISFYVN